MFISDILKNQPAIEDRLPPLRYHVSEHCVQYGNNRLLLTVELSGIPFVTIDDELIESHFDSLNTFFASLGKDKGSRLATWLHVCHRKVSTDFDYQFGTPFMAGFASKYLARFRDGDYFENRFYVSLVLKYDDLNDGIKDLEELGLFVHKSLSRYGAEILGTYEKNGIACSEVYRFLGELVNGFEEDVPLSATPLSEVLGNSHLHFGVDVMAIKGNHDRHKYATCFDLKDFPHPTKSGLFDCLLKLPFEFTLTQSFVYLTQGATIKAFDEQINKLVSVNDAADHQIAEIDEARGFVSSGELVFGDYHAALIVYGPDGKAARENGETARSTLLGESGARFVKATLSAPLTYFGQIPGAIKSRPRTMPKSSRNLAAGFAMHTYSSGKASGNPIGDGSAAIPLQTTTKGLYNFNFHYSRENEDNTGEKIAGHTLILGATGTGKTVAQSTLLGFIDRFDPKLFAIDKDFGMKIFIQAQGGTYFSLKAGEPTGLNPFQLEDTPKNRDYLNDLLKVCGLDNNGKITADDEQKIKVAVDTNFSLPFESRRFSRVLETIPSTGENDLAARLRKWTHAGNGRFAWALDNATNAFDVGSYRKIGFDVTDFLKPGYEPTGPVLSYLFHLKSLMQQDGELMATVVEEFWLPAQFKITADIILDILKTGRKRGEFILLISQSPEDAINSEIFAPIVQQTPTKVLLPNPSAKYEGGYQAINLTKKEFVELKKLSEDSRTFLVKQGNQSTFAVLDLYGFGDEIAVISGTTENVVLLDRIAAVTGHDPDLWLPIFQKLRKEKSVSDEAIHGELDRGHGTSDYEHKQFLEFSEEFLTNFHTE